MTDEISIGDYVLTGGELAAMVMVDAISRLLPGVLADASPQEESHSHHMLEYPQYTRPADFRGWPIPDVLLSGHHANIARWQRKEALRMEYMQKARELELARSVQARLLKAPPAILNLDAPRHRTFSFEPDTLGLCAIPWEILRIRHLH